MSSLLRAEKLLTRWVGSRCSRQKELRGKPRNLKQHGAFKELQLVKRYIRLGRWVGARR